MCVRYPGDVHENGEFPKGTKIRLQYNFGESDCELALNLVLV